MKTINIPRIYISAIKKSSGKTIIAVAINRILLKKGLTVQPFKKGPDFIDPMWHTKAANRSCRNLDFFFLPDEKLLAYFADKTKESDIAVIEGNHGLFDDINTKGETDNASLAKLLKSPVILVMDVKEMGRSIVPIILGCSDFDKSLRIGGIILNKIQSYRQEKRLKEAISLYTDIPIVGAIPETDDIHIPYRHLGLFSTLKDEEKEQFISKLAEFAERFLDIETIIKIANTAETTEFNIQLDNNDKEKFNITIGIAYDKAFNFYYKDNFEEMEKYGCKLKFFSPLYDSHIPCMDALYIGGGFPEIFAKTLENNLSIKKEINAFIDNNMPVYAECGGLIYLTNSITYNNKRYKMVSAIKTETSFHKKPVGHGYTILKPTKNAPGWWSKIQTVKGHEFHHASLSEKINRFAFEVKRGFGIDGKHDGIAINNLLASFTHIYAPSSSFFREWIRHISLRK